MYACQPHFTLIVITRQAPSRMIYSANPMTMNKSLRIKYLENLNSLNRNAKAATGALKGVLVNQGQNSTKNVATTAHPHNQKRSHGLSAEDKISQAEGVIKSLKRYTDKGTCPETLQYRARILRER